MKHAVTYLLLLGCLLMPAAAHAQSSAEKVKQGMGQMRQGRWDQAERTFILCLETHPNHPDITAFLGMTRYHLKKYDAAISNLRIALNRGTSHAARSLYYLGLSYAAAGQKDKAEQAFTVLMLAYPKSPEARKLGVLPDDVIRDLVDIRRRPARQFFLSADVGYSTNPSRTDDGDGDLFVSGYASAKTPIRSSDVRAGASVSIDKYASEDENDYLAVAASLEREWLLTGQDSVEPSLEISRSWYGGDSYDMTVALQADYDRTWNDRWDSNCRLRYTLSNDLAGDDQNADANTVAIRLRGWRQCGGPRKLKRLRLTGGWESEDADTSYLGYTGMDAGIEFRLGGPGGTSVDLGVEYEQREYADENPTYAVTRDDTTTEFNITGLGPAGKSKYWRVELSYASRDSNIDEYSANEAMLTFGILWLP